MRYAIFGLGRVGANMAAYLESLGHRVEAISRRDAATAREATAARVASCDVVAAAIPDDRLSGFFGQWRGEIGARIAIHFSGAVRIPGVHGFHPLYSFPKERLRPEALSRIAFACPENGPSFNDVFPDADNPHFEIPEDARAHYHALAVLSGNFAAFLWNETAKSFEKRYAADAGKIMAAYLSSVIDRFAEAPTASMTGPLARRDRQTVKANLAALEDEPQLKALYAAFLALAWPDYEKPD